MIESMPHPGYLTGQCLIAMPMMDDPRFEHSLVYICAHTEDGAMGIIVNKSFDLMTFPELLQQLDIDPTPECDRIQVQFGGPVEESRGFVLHSMDYEVTQTLIVAGQTAHIGLTANVEVLRAIAAGRGPRRSLMALGYAGWAPGQLEDEIKANWWLTVDADEALLFDGDLDSRWQGAMSKLGVDLSLLNENVGRA